MKLGLIGVAISFLCGATIHALAVPWLASADEPLHLDYVWQIGHGSLPEFFEGPQIPIDREMPPVQWAYQHPPLYYLALAPVVLPVFDAFGWESATLAGRFMTVGMGLAFVFILAWATWIFTDGNRLYTVAVPAIVTSMVPFVGTAAAVYNDVLAVMLFTVALGLSARIIKDGPQNRDLVLLVLVALAGMSTRASFIGMLGLIVLAIPYAYWLCSGDHPRHPVVRGVVVSAAILAVVVVGIGWFYVRNVELSGTWTGGQSEWANANRNRNDPRSLYQTLTDPTLYTYFPRWLFGKPDADVGLRGTGVVGVAVFVLGMIGTATAAIRNKWWRRWDYVWIGVAGLLLLHTGLILGQQAVHLSGGAGLLFRYYLPLALPVGLLLAAGALMIRRLHGLGVVAVAGFGWIALMNKLGNLSVGPTGEEPGVLQLLGSLSANNGMPTVVFAILSVGLVVGLAVQATALWRLTQLQAAP